MLLVYLVCFTVYIKTLEALREPVDCGKHGKFVLRKSSSHKGDEDVWATGYKGDMFEVETSEVAATAEWWIRLGEKEWTILSKPGGRLGSAGSPPRFSGGFGVGRKNLAVITAENLFDFKIPFSIKVRLKFNQEPFHRYCIVENIKLMDCRNETALMTVTPNSSSKYQDKGTAKCKTGYASINSNEVECSSAAKWVFANKKSICFRAPKNVKLRVDGHNDTGSGILQVCENKTVKLYCTNSPSNPPVQNYKIITNSKTISNEKYVLRNFSRKDQNKYVYCVVTAKSVNNVDNNSYNSGNRIINVHFTPETANKTIKCKWKTGENNSCVFSLSSNPDPKIVNLYIVRLKKAKQEVMVPNFTYEVQKTAENIYSINITTIEEHHLMHVYSNKVELSVKSSDVCKTEVRVPIEMELMGSYDPPSQLLTAYDYTMYFLALIVLVLAVAIVLIGRKLEIMKSIKSFGKKKSS